ncbi:MAG: L-seryl-tRNA(Sec) selenium transferase, partial [Desulfovibrio sp.]|nr:L-seryl-tRNA(Sec) selenium transferase [Desulfovibrio sp.]
IPTLRRIFLSPLLLKEKARSLERCLAQSLGDLCRIAIREDVSRVGGGAFPQYDLPTWLVCLMPTSISATTLKRRLLETTPPLIGRLEDDAFCLDPRTLEEDDFSLVGRLLSAALTGASSNETGEVRF